MEEKYSTESHRSGCLAQPRGGPCEFLFATILWKDLMCLKCDYIAIIPLNNIKGGKTWNTALS